MTKVRFYTIFFAACCAGYFWLFYLNIFNSTLHELEGTVCLVKNITGIPCPSCGSSRAIISLTQGNFIESLHWNPFGFLLAVMLLAAPVWITTDLLLGNETLLRYYVRMERLLQQKAIAVLSIVLVLLNWFWNIQKGL